MGPLLSVLCNHLTPNRYLHLWLKIIENLIQPAGGVNGSLFQNSCLKNPLDRGAWGLQSIGLQRVRHDWAHIHTIHLESGYLPGMRWYQIHNSPEMLQNWKMKEKWKKNERWFMRMWSLLRSTLPTPERSMSGLLGKYLNVLCHTRSPGYSTWTNADWNQ